MSKSEIQSWAQRVEGDDGVGTRFDWESLDEKWDDFLKYAQLQVTSGKTKIRTVFLQERLLPLAARAGLDLPKTIDLFKLLILTYPRYIDSASRAAVVGVLKTMVQRDEERGKTSSEINTVKIGVAEQIVPWLHREATSIHKSVGAVDSGNFFVLLSWIGTVLDISLEFNPTFKSTRLWESSLQAAAALLDGLLNPATPAKPSLRQAAIVRLRRTFRENSEHLTDAIEAVLKFTKTLSSPVSAFPLLGLLLDVVFHLKTPKNGAEVIAKVKQPVLSLYGAVLLASRTVPPNHVSTALQVFFGTSVSEQDHDNVILPAIEKALLRTPEIALKPLADLYKAYPREISSTAFPRLLTAILNCSKSTNAVVRAGSADLWHVIATKVNEEQSSIAFTEIIGPLAAGKTTSIDHKITLFHFLASLPPSNSVSGALVTATIPLLIKETNEAAISALVLVIPRHTAYGYGLSGGCIDSATSALICKELASSKAPLHKALVIIVGETFWSLVEQDTSSVSPGAIEFAKAVIPLLEKNLQLFTGSPLTSPFGANDGYVSATLLCLFAKSFNQTQSTTLQALVATGAKPSFLFWERVYTKVIEEQEAIWLVRALQQIAITFSSEIRKSEQLSLSFGQVLLWLIAEFPLPDVRRLASSTLVKLSAVEPLTISYAIRYALSQSLSKPPNPIATLEEEPTGNHRGVRLAQALISATSFQDQPEEIKDKLLGDLLVVAHDSEFSRNMWIELIQRVNVDPEQLILRQQNNLLQLVLHSLDPNASDAQRTAALRAITTLAFVSPNKALPSLVAIVKQDMDPELLRSLTQFDYDVWSMPEGTPFVDVLASTKKDVIVEKGKDAELKKWDAETKKALAIKKGPPPMSKQEKALVDAQLAKEQIVRDKVQSVQYSLRRGLAVLQGVLAARVEQLGQHFSSIADCLLSGVLKNGFILVDEEAILAYLSLFSCASERLGTHGKWIGVAVLRGREIEGMPESLTAEPLHSLVSRILYRLRTLAEQLPLDASTFALLAPLLNVIILKGGLAVDEDNEEDSLEQLTLTLDFIKFHAAEFSDPVYPRIDVLEGLVHIIARQPKLSREAVAVLVEVGEALHESSTREEQDTLLRHTKAQEVYVRNAVLQALQPFDLTDVEWSPDLFIACHDDDVQNGRLARQLCDENDLEIPEKYISSLIPLFDHDHRYVRQSCARAFAEAVEIHPSTKQSTLDALKTHYIERAKELVPEFDEYGMVIASTLNRQDPWETRLAIAHAILHIGPHFRDEDVLPFFDFLITDQALGDRHVDVRRGMLDAGVAVIDFHGKERLAGLISLFESYLGSSKKSTTTDDNINQAVVILFGRVAQHLDQIDPRIPQVLDRLVEALKTPSEVVQEAVSKCLSPLVKLVPSQVGGLIDRSFEELLRAPKYAARRGAAYGLAGIISGTGVAAIHRYEIIRRLRDAVNDKKNYEARQGASFAFETIYMTLGRGFEPYIVQILPLLLTSFGDAHPEVREATIDASKVIMGKLTGYGVKLVLPSLLSGLEERQWRTKKGSVELLGSMAFCAPKQFSASLPTIIPQLSGVLTDSHAQVRSAGNKSLKQFGEVISNPEIQSLVSTLLKALIDPEKTPNALNAILKKSFVHYIDSASLAIVIPIVERGLRERSADTKRKATHIVGNLVSLTDSKDFIPYLTTLLPLVHIVLVDPVPEARATAAKALGTLIERLGEAQFPDMVPSLLKTLKSNTSGVDRQGAAQGLSEVLSGLGMERLEGLLPEIISNTSSPRPYVREGFMSLLVYLPATFGARFQPHLAKIVSPILNGLADSEEFVREASMKAGRMIVVNYSNKAVDLLLPELERGMFDPGWRIRQSSITLIGELLFRLSGISGKSELEEDEEATAAVAETSRKVLTEVLGKERRDRVLASLYLVRQDSVVHVRQASIHIWKALVHNTPRTVREILSTLMAQILDCLSSQNAEQRETAARTIGELCRKLGERILGDIVPILKTGSNSRDPRTREGVCLAISEIMESSSGPQREEHEDEIIIIVRQSLVDDSASVRAAAAVAFDVLQDTLGTKAIDETIPTLLEALRQPGESSGTALQALREVMSVRASTVFPVLIPTLIATPITAFNARALASLVTVAGNALSKRLTTILTALIRAVENEKDEELKSDINEAVRALLGSISDAEGLQTLMLLLAGWAKNESWTRRVSALNFFGTFCEVTTLDFSIYRPDWVRYIVSLMDDRQPEVVDAAVRALDPFVKSLDKDDLESLVVTLRRTIESTGSPGRTVPGFDAPKGIAPMLPIIIAGLTTGSNEQREQAAYTIGDLVERTSEVAIKPFVVQLTGPLIRVATQASAYPPGVKVAILKSLTAMLEHIPVFVKPFFPQLQRTFVKSASDASSLAVRGAAARALGVLMRSSTTRVDALVTELITSAKGSTDEEIAASLFLACAHVLKSAIASVSSGAREIAVEVIEAAFKEHHDDRYLQAISMLFTSLEPFPDLLQPIIQSHIVFGTPPSMLGSQIILRTIEDAPKLFYTLGCVAAVLKKIQQSIGDPNPGISRPAREAKDLARTVPPFADDDAVHQVFGG